MTTKDYIRGVRSGLFTPFDKRLWQRSFHDHIARNDAEYDRLAQCIHE